MTRAVLIAIAASSLPLAACAQESEGWSEAAAETWAASLTGEWSGPVVMLSQETGEEGEHVETIRVERADGALITEHSTITGQEPESWTFAYREGGLTISNAEGQGGEITVTDWAETDSGWRLSLTMPAGPATMRLEQTLTGDEMRRTQFIQPPDSEAWNQVYQANLARTD